MPFGGSNIVNQGGLPSRGVATTTAAVPPMVNIPSGFSSTRAQIGSQGPIANPVASKALTGPGTIDSAGSGFHVLPLTGSQALTMPTGTNGGNVGASVSTLGLPKTSANLSSIGPAVTKVSPNVMTFNGGGFTTPAGTQAVGIGGVGSPTPTVGGTTTTNSQTTSVGNAISNLLSGGGAATDSAGSGFHLGSGLFNQGSSAQGFSSGGSGSGTPGSATSGSATDTSGVVGWLTANWILVVAAIAVLAIILMAVR